MLTYPSVTRPDAVACILYYSDAEVCGGSTRVVPTSQREPYELRRCEGRTECARCPERRPDLYATERAVKFVPGTVLMYNLGTWHRGTVVKAGEVRMAHHIGLRRADAEWVQYSSIASALRSASNFDLDRYIAEQLNPTQRCLLGFPHEGHEKWRQAGALDDVAARYGAMFDPSPYVSAPSVLSRLATARM